MATIEDLDLSSISDMDTNELHELLRQIRHSRRTPKRKISHKKPKKKKEINLDNISADDAALLLEQLKEKIK